MGVKDSFLGKLLGNADKYTDEQVAQTVSMLVENGVRHRASDIHIEPADRFASVRYRVDGVLHSKHKLPIAALPAVIAEIKQLADMHVDDHHLPQEGQYAMLVGAEQLEVQVHTLPVVGGEKVVLHLLRRLAKPPTLQELGYWGEGLHALQTALSRTHGYILVAAPRRSGNTTTLHSLLQMVVAPSISVATIEPALEYRVTGATQTVVRPHHGITFQQGLRAALNQDPNVVMVSSVPDHATAELSIQAAVGGHLVLAGIHANNTATGLTHLRSLAEEPYLLATAIRAVLSQRLVRSLCRSCRKHAIPTPEEVAELERAFGITTPAARKRLHELEVLAAHAGIGTSTQANTTPSHIVGMWQADEDGCEACGHTGFTGSLAITEVLLPSEALQKALLDHEPASRLHQAALKSGFVPLELDGLVKALRGQTTIQEVLRTFTP
jgi:type IV pilus assembly protein PilB